MRGSWLATVSLAAIACATAPSPFVVSVAGGESTLRCAATELGSAGYDVDLSDTAAEANRVTQLGPAEADRDVIALSLVGGPQPMVAASVRRWSYSPSMHSLPVNRQHAEAVSVDDQTSLQVTRIMQSCQAP